MPQRLRALEAHAHRAPALAGTVELLRGALIQIEEAAPGRWISLRLETTPERDLVRFIVQDNGVGIPAENLTRIFAHGFTTRKDGHGFGLHSCALAAMEMGFLCPPAGMNVYFSSAMFKKPVSEVAVAVLPALFAIFLGTLAIASVPWLATGLPRLLGALA